MKKSPGRPKNPPKVKDMLKSIIPVGDIFNEEEEKIYLSLVDVYLGDFEEKELTSVDMDDIMTLATNKVLELRLLKATKSDTDKQLDIANAVDKIRKQSEKIKENLSVRRRDRIDPNKYKGFSIVDLAVAFDENKKSELLEKFKRLDGEAEEEIVEMFEEYDGNKNDVDAGKEKEDEGSD